MGRTAMRTFAVLLLAMMAGCSSEPKETPVYKVRGRVTFEGRAVNKATIDFVPVNLADRGLQGHSITDQDGNYVLQTYRTGDGAPEGEYIVVINWPGLRKGKPAPGDDEDAGGLDQLKDKYSVTKSSLRATVKAQTENVIDFKLP